MKSIKACQLGAVAAAPMVVTSPPKFALHDISHRLIRLPDGRIVTITDATELEFRSFVAHVIEQMEKISRECIVAGTASKNHAYKQLSDARALRNEPVSNMDERWYVLFELREARGGSGSRYASVELFVGESQEAGE